MKFQAIAAGKTLSVLFLTIMAACTPPQTPSSESGRAVETGSPEASPENLANGEEPTEAQRQTYDGAPFNFPISAQYPDTMQIEDGCAGEGCGFFFTFVPQGNALDTAEVHIFLPAGVATATEQEPFVTGPNGLIENAGWSVNDMESGATEQFPYPWVEKVINFSSDREESGHILLGETAGQAVQVLLLYPSEMADDYWPAANVVLETLEFNSDLLPLTTSSEGPATGDDPATM